MRRAVDTAASTVVTFHRDAGGAREWGTGMAIRVSVGECVRCRREMRVLLPARDGDGRFCADCERELRKQAEATRRR